MHCQYCNEKIEVVREPSDAVWTVRCECASAQHNWLERAIEMQKKWLTREMEMQLKAVYEKNRDSLTVPITDMEPSAGNEQMGEG